MANRLKRMFSTVLCAMVLLTMTAVPGTAFAETTDEPEKAAQTETQALASENEAGGVAQKQETTQFESQEEAKAPAQESQAAPQTQMQAAKSQTKAVAPQAARARSVSISGATTSKCNQSITLTATPSEFDAADDSLMYRWYYKATASSRAQELTSFGNRQGVKSWNADKSGIYYVTVYNSLSPTFKYTSEDKVITITGHANVTAVPAVEPTCTTAGNKAHYKCNDCNKLFSDADGKTEISAPVVIPAHGLQAVAKVNATCTTNGTEAYWKCKDSACGKLYADADGRTEINSPESIAATGHQEAWKAVGNNEGKCEKYCKTCNAVLYGPVNHVVTYTPSSTDPTKHARRCENCNMNLPEENHVYGDFVVDTKATCTTAGSKSKHCEKCDVKTDVTAIPANGHDMKKTEAHAATCTASGNNEYYACKICDQVFKDEAGTTPTTAAAEITEPIAHDLTKTEAKPATCTENGHKAYWTCRSCGQLFADENGKTAIEKPEVIEATGHTLTLVPQKDATCTEEGYEAYWKCDVCDHMFTSKEASEALDAPVVIPATGHKFGEWKVVKEPTVEEAGMKERVCEKCSYTETAAIPALQPAKADLTGKTELNKTKETADKSDDSAKTGDDMNVTLYSLLALLAASGAVGVAYRRRTTEK